MNRAFVDHYFNVAVLGEIWRAFVKLTERKAWVTCDKRKVLGVAGRRGKTGQHKKVRT